MLVVDVVRAERKLLQNPGFRGFPGGPVAKTPHSQCRGSRFTPWSGI